MDCAAGRFAFAGAFSSCELHRSRRWADKESSGELSFVPLYPFKGLERREEIDFGAVPF